MKWKLNVKFNQFLSCIVFNVLFDFKREGGQAATVEKKVKILKLKTQ